MSTNIAELQKQLALTKQLLALSVALHDRLLEENRELKGLPMLRPAPREVHHA